MSLANSAGGCRCYVNVLKINAVLSIIINNCCRKNQSIHCNDVCFIVCMYVSFCLTSGAVNLKVLRLDLKDLSQINWLYARTSLVYKALCRNLKTSHSGITTSKYEAGIVSESNSLSFKFYLMLQHLKLKQMCFS